MPGTDVTVREVPGRERDAEVQGAVLGHEYIRPVRWSKPAVLILERHEYIQELMPPFEEVRSLGRLYEIRVTISPEGNSVAAWKLQKDR